MRVIDQLSERCYILESERNLPESEQTRFYIKGLPYDLFIRIQSEISPVIKLPGKALGGKAVDIEDSEVELRPGARQRLEFEILSAGLVRVENLINEVTGEEITYPGPRAPDNVKKDWFARWLPAAVRTELANAITEGSALTEEDQKN